MWAVRTTAPTMHRDPIGIEERRIQDIDSTHITRHSPTHLLVHANFFFSTDQLATEFKRRPSFCTSRHLNLLTFNENLPLEKISVESKWIFTASLQLRKKQQTRNAICYFFGRQNSAYKHPNNLFYFHGRRKTHL